MQPPGSLLPERPLQYRAGDSRLHRLGAGWKLASAAALGAAAIALHSIPVLLALLLTVTAGYAWARLPLRALWKDLRWLLLQAVIVVLLTVALRGGEAFERGCRTALQLMGVFLPVALLLRTTASESLLELLRGWLPERLGFACAATLRFLPVFARELAELVEMQRLRGARLAPGDLWRPVAWRDWLACVALPMSARAIEVAEQAAEAAEIRGVGARERDRRPDH